MRPMSMMKLTILWILETNRIDKNNDENDCNVCTPEASNDESNNEINKEVAEITNDEINNEVEDEYVNNVAVMDTTNAKSNDENDVGINEDAQYLMIIMSS